MKAIEQYNAKVSIDEEVYTGQIKEAYTKNIKNSMSQGLRTAVFSSYEKGKEKVVSSINNIVNYTKNNPELAKRVITGALILTMSATFTGCKMMPNAKEVPSSNIEQMQDIEQTGEIKYIIEFGDTLDSIVSRYKDDGISNEVKKVATKNEISNPDKIYAGQQIILDVPISKLENFGYTYTTGEVSTWDSMDYFVYSAFSVPENEVHPQNVMFWRDKQYVVGGESPHEIETYGETPLLLKAASARYDLDIMNNDQIGFYKEEDIKKKETEITGYYLEAIEITTRNTGKKFGEDYISEPSIKAIPLEKSIGK